MKLVLKVLSAVIISVFLVFPMGLAALASQGNEQGDIVKLTGDIYVNEGNTVEGDTVALKGDIFINGKVTGDVVAVFGNIIVNGEVLGDAITVSGKITVGEKGKIMGDTVEALGGISRGNRSYNYNYDYRPGFSMGPWSRAADIFFSFLSTLGLFLMASLVYLVMPSKIEKMADSIEPNLGKRIGIGVLALIGSPIAMVILTVALAITLIGILIIPFAWIAYLIAGLVSLVPVYVYIGKKVASLVANQNIATYGAMASGLFTLWMVDTLTSFGGLYTGWIGWIIYFVVFTLGTGTLIDYIITNRKRKPEFIPYTPEGGVDPSDGSSVTSLIPKQKENRLENISDENADGGKK